MSHALIGAHVSLSLSVADRVTRRPDDDARGVAILTLCEVAAEWVGPPEEFPGYLATAVRRAVIRERRRMRRWVSFAPGFAESLPDRESEPDTLPDLAAVLAGLGDDDREILEIGVPLYASRHNLSERNSRRLHAAALQRCRDIVGVGSM